MAEHKPAAMAEQKPAVFLHAIERRYVQGNATLEILRGAELAIPREELPPPGEDEFYEFQLVGLGVEEEGGRALGSVVAVIPGPANDVIELDSGLLLPLVGACVQQVDLDAGRIQIARGFADPS